MKETVFHELLIDNQEVRNSVLNALNIKDYSYEFVHEDQYPNGLYADFTVKKGNVVKAILELKGSDIGVNDFVRGVGQVFEYQHFADSNMSIKGYEYDDAVAVYLLPSSITQQKSFNIGLFKYPEKTVLMELNEHNHNVRLISEKELQNLAEAEKSDLVSISQYYIRDNRLFELYLCLKYCQIQMLFGKTSVDRKEAEKTFLQKLNTPNNNNWRNAFISLSSLGLIDTQNLPTIIGSKYATGTYSNFAYEMYQSYIKVYIDLLMGVLYKFKEKEKKDVFVAKYNDIANIINKMYMNKKVMFVTDSDNRYLSSWLNIMRDDYRCIDFESRQNERTILYNIGEMNKDSIIKKINNNKLANKYIDKMNELLNS